MKKAVLALMSLVFCGTVQAAPEEKPMSHYLANATANTFNRLKTFDGYYKLISNRVPPEQMKEVKAFFKAKGVTGSTKFPKMTAENEKACFDKTNCFTFTSDSVAWNGVTFKYSTEKNFATTLQDICNKVGCEAKSAGLSIIPKAHAGINMWGLLGGAVLGGVVGNFAADSVCSGDKTQCTVGGALIGGGLGTLLFSDQEKQTCGGSCSVSCRDESYYIQPRRPVGYDVYGQQQPPYRVPPEVYYRTHGQYQQPCDQYVHRPEPRPHYPNRPTDLEIALNRPHRPGYCNGNPQGYCNDLPPYQPPGYQQQPPVADVRAVSSEGAKEKAPAKNEKSE